MSMKIEMKILLIDIILILLFIACGKDSVSLNPQYEPKIVINAFLYPEQPIDKIRISRNWPLNENIEYSKLILDNSTAEVVCTDLSDNTAYPLSFHADSGYYYNGELLIAYGGRYQLDIRATIDGKELSASSVTEVPLAGFQMIDSLFNDSYYFYTRNAQNEYQIPVITFQRSAGTDFYVFSIVALDASVSSFIYDHPYLPTDIEEKDIIENFNDFKYSHEAVFNIPKTPGITTWEIMKYHTWFYGRYRVIAYAGDKNYKDYYLTHADVQEMDGNYHEPKFNISGDGIGVFGSVIADTLYFELLKN
jgi:hypothetical protein